jgi:pyruvate formate lyase activating enzyme
LLKIRIGGVLDISTIDWPGHVTFMIFAAGCNFKCPYCQNASLIPLNSGREVEVEEVKRRIVKNYELLDAVGFTGGEPALQPHAVKEVFYWTKKLGLKTFINTNGSNPSLIEELADQGIIDHVALDVKAPLTPETYGKVIGLACDVKSIVEKIGRTIYICRRKGIPFEARTTIVPTLVDSEDSVGEIARAVAGCESYVLQQYSPTGDILDEKFKNMHPPKRETLVKLARAALKAGLSKVKVRTRERGEEVIKP